MRELKPKPCSWCRKEYIRWNSTQTTCSVNCALAKLKDKQERGLIRDISRAEKIKRADTKKRKEALKSRSDWLREAQTAFNKFIRLRDDHLGICISCQKPPKKKNAGHYKSRGAFPELRFDEDNCHLQCEHCNSFKSGNQVEYRIHLVKKIGIERVEKLEQSQSARNWSIDDIKEIKATYQQRCREL